MAGKIQNKKTASKKGSSKVVSKNSNTKIKLANSKKKTDTSEKVLVPVQNKKTATKNSKAKKYENRVKRINELNSSKKVEKKVKKASIEEIKKEKKNTNTTKKVIVKQKNEPKIVKDSTKKVTNKQKKHINIKKIPSNIKIIIILAIICVLVLGIEGVYLLLNRNNNNSNVVYNDVFNSTAVDGNKFVVAGASDFHYSKLNSENENTRGRLIKYDLNGKVLFEVIYEKGLSSSFNYVLNVWDGYIVVGTGIFSKEEKEAGGKEAFIIKYDKKGEIIWEKFCKPLTDSSFNKVIEVSDGFIAIGQSIYANMELGNDPNGGGIIVKYDKDGNELWRSFHGGTKSGNFNDIVQVGKDFYVVGKDGADAANIVKFNSKGEYQWHKNYKYTDSFGFGGMIYYNNSLYVVGSKKVLPEDVGDEDDRSTPNTDAVLVRYDLNGNVLFEKSYGGSSYERFNSIAVFENDIYVVGHFCSKDAGLKSTTPDNEKMTGFLIRYDLDGNILKKEVFGGSNNDNLKNIYSDGVSIYITGYSNSKDGNINNNNSNGKDYFGILLKLNSKLKILIKK